MRNFSIVLLVIALCCACGSRNGASNREVSTARYRYFDLITLQGVDPCDNDSSVTVSYMGDSLKIEYDLPEKYVLTLYDKGDYWYSHGEFDMHIDRYNLTMCDVGGPRIYDRFIRKDSIIEYCQMFTEDDVYKYIFVKTPELYTIYDFDVEYDTDTDAEAIYDRILKVLNGDHRSINDISLWEVRRGTREVEFIDNEGDYTISRTYPDVLIWGGDYGI